MVKLYYNRVVIKTITFSEVPDKLKEQVKQLLINNGFEELINE